MSGKLNDPVEILDDDSDETLTTTPRKAKKELTTNTPRAGSCSINITKSKMANDPEPQASTSKQIEDKPVDNNEEEEEPEDENPSEYNVEAIRAKRKNRNGVDEYFIKWEGYSENENTWEPLENLKCPELISKFNENEANKRRRKKAERMGAAASTQASGNKRPRRESAVAGASSQATEETGGSSNGLFVEDDDDDDDDFEAHTEQTRKKSKGNQQRDTHQTSEPVGQRGFNRGLPIERIITASIGDDDKLYFFIKWQGRNEIELVDADELEKKGSYALCRWYRDRLYYESKEAQQARAQ